MRCPRCQGEVEARAGACPRCGAPLRLPEEPALPALDRPLDLDRRTVPRAEPPLGLEDTAPGPFSPRAPPANPRPRITPAFWAEPGPVPARTPSTSTPEGPQGPQGPIADPVSIAGEGDFELLGPASEEPAAGEEASPTPVIELHFTVASRGERLLSWAVDGILCGALAWLLVAGGVRLAGGAAAPPLGAVAVLAALLHFTHATLGCALAGRTLGKWMAGVEVVGPEGRFPSPGRAALRAGLSLLTAGLLLPLLLALADRKGRALHDHLLRTAVVRPP